MPKLIKGWKDLVGLETEDYYLDIDLEMCNGHIRPKEHVQVNDENYFEHTRYLSTHTFYGLDYKGSTIELQEHGFDVQLENWDGETEWVDYKEQWLHNGKCEFCRRNKYCNKKCKAALKREEDERKWGEWREQINKKITK